MATLTYKTPEDFAQAYATTVADHTAATREAKGRVELTAWEVYNIETGAAVDAFNSTGACLFGPYDRTRKAAVEKYLSARASQS